MHISNERLRANCCSVQSTKDRFYSSGASKVEIVKGQRTITADTSLRLAHYFGVSAKFWLGLQDDYDLEEAKAKLGIKLYHLTQHAA